MLYRVDRQCFLALWLCCVMTMTTTWAFVPVTRRPTTFQASTFTSTSTTTTGTSSLQMAKKMKNKQAELAKKMADAKNQAGGGTPVDDVSATAKLSAQEVKEQNDRLRFEELLKTQASSVLNDYSSDGYLNKKQEEEEIMASRSGVERLFEGDPAPSLPFEELVTFQSENAIGADGAKRLVPWLRNTNTNDFLIILCDPRMKSSELHETVQNLKNTLTKDIRSRLIVVNADTPAENRRWLKKASMLEQEEEIRVYSDEKLDWMRAYTALGDKRWTMTMFIIQNEKAVRIAREVDGVSATRVVTNAVKSLNQEPSM